jgi:hypothetical protein
MNAVPANGVLTVTFTITDPAINFGTGDTVIFNTRTDTFEQGLIAQWAVPNTNIVKLRLYNTTASPITPADRIVYATIISNIFEVIPASVSKVFS